MSTSGKSKRKVLSSSQILSDAHLVFLSTGLDWQVEALQEAVLDDSFQAEPSAAKQRFMKKHVAQSASKQRV